MKLRREMNRFGKGEERGRKKLLSPTQCEKLPVIEPSLMWWRFCYASVVCLQPRSFQLRQLYSVGSSSQMPLGMECRWNEREAERGTWARGILKYLGKKNEVNTSIARSKRRKNCFCCYTTVAYIFLLNDSIVSKCLSELMLVKFHVSTV